MLLTRATPLRRSACAALAARAISQHAWPFHWTNAAAAASRYGGGGIASSARIASGERRGMATRSESDAFGPIDVDSDVLWGAQTQRSLQVRRRGVAGGSSLPCVCVCVLCRAVLCVCVWSLDPLAALSLRSLPSLSFPSLPSFPCLSPRSSLPFPSHSLRLLSLPPLLLPRSCRRTFRSEAAPHKCLSR